MAYPWPSSVVDLPNQQNWEELATRIPWGTADIADDSIGSEQIAPDAVGTSEIADGSVTDAKMGLTVHEDVQTSNISADGVLTGISITPGAGSYVAIAMALHNNNATAASAKLFLRVNGTNGIQGPDAGGDGSLTTINFSPLIVMGIVTPGGGQAVEVYGDLNGGTISGGRLVLVRIAP